MPLNVNKLRINADDSLKNTIVNKTGLDDTKCIPDTINRIIDEAGSGEGAEYTGGTGIDVDNTTHTIINTLPGISYNGKNGIDVSGSDISAKIDGDTIKLNSQGEMYSVGGGGGGVYTGGIGIDVNNTDNTINAKIDGDTIKVNEQNQLYSVGGGGGKTYTGGTGINVDNQNDKINAIVDDVTIGVNSDNQLQAEKYEINITSKSGGEGKTYTGGNGIEVDNTKDTITAKINTATMEFVDGKLSAKGGSSGVTKINKGTNISVSPTTGVGEVTINNTYSLPTASTTTLGGVKVDGTSITINNGKISATGGSSGVTKITKGNGITISPTTGIGTVQITNSGVTSFNGSTGAVTGIKSISSGTGISVDTSSGVATITNTSPGKTYSAGSGISISGTTISNTSPGKTYTGGDGISISGTTISNTSPGKTYSGGTGITVSGTTIYANTYIVEKTTGIGCSLTSGIGSWRYGAVGNITKYGNSYIDIVEVTADTYGQWGQLSYNVYTGNNNSLSVYPWAYKNGTGGGDVQHTMVYLYTLYASGTYMTPLEKQYEKEKFEYLFGDPYVRATRYNMYIPDKQDIIISKNEQSFSLEQYIPDIYYSGQEGDVYKVALKDCKISPYNTNEVGIQKIDIKYVGEHNHYDDKERIGPASIYLKVEE